MPSPKPQEGKGGRSYVEKPLCAKCDKRHDGKCLVGMGNFYGCGKSGHMKRHFPMMKSQERGNSQVQASAQTRMLLRRITCMLQMLEVIKRAPRMWLNDLVYI